MKVFFPALGSRLKLISPITFTSNGWVPLLRLLNMKNISPFTKESLTLPVGSIFKLEGVYIKPGIENIAYSLEDLPYGELKILRSITKGTVHYRSNSRFYINRADNNNLDVEVLTQ